MKTNDKMTREQIFKLIFEFYVCDCKDHYLSDYNFMPNSFNVPLKRLVEFMMREYPYLYSEWELKHCLADCPDFDSINNPVCFFELISMIHPDDDAIDYRDFYFIADYLNKKWDRAIAKLLKHYADQAVVACSDPDLKEDLALWKPIYNRVDKKLNHYRPRYAWYRS